MTVTATAPASPSSALNSLLGSNAGSAAAATPSATEQNDRFLKLLVTQMQNQDPLNPMDNAQVTTQMAQISTVSGIDKLGSSIAQMNSLMLQSQTLQGAALVGKSVLVAGNDLSPDASGLASAGFELDGPADAVSVSVTDAAGKVVDTIGLGHQDAGRHGFDWQAPAGSTSSYHFAVSAKSGAQTVGATPLTADSVAAVYTDGSQLTVQLRNHGDVGLADLKSVF